MLAYLSESVRTLTPTRVCATTADMTSFGVWLRVRPEGFEGWEGGGVSDIFTRQRKK